jgi:hypothetical protein
MRWHFRRLNGSSFEILQGGRVPRVLQFGLIALAALAGCGHDNTPAPPPARVPGRDEVRSSDDTRFAKPLPEQTRNDLPPPPFDDVPLVSQQAPETARFVEAYHKVGSPRILVWVVHEAGAAYDEAAARSIDYAAMQTILTDWFSSGGSVAVISAQAARQSLGGQQVQNLDAGQNVNGKEINDRTRADVLVMVRAQPTRQSNGGPMVRLVADASNLVGGESIGRAVVDVPPPLDKPQLNTYTRFLARKLMKDMTGSWTGFGSGPAPASQPR